MVQRRPIVKERAAPIELLVVPVVVSDTEFEFWAEIIPNKTAHMGQVHGEIVRCLRFACLIVRKSGHVHNGGER